MPTPQTIEEWSGQFIVLIYDRNSSLDSVNEARKQLFTQKGRIIDGLPPTQAALLQHIERVLTKLVIAGPR